MELNSRTQCKDAVLYNIFPYKGLNHRPSVARIDNYNIPIANIQNILLPLHCTGLRHPTVPILYRNRRLPLHVGGGRETSHKPSAGLQDHRGGSQGPGSLFRIAEPMEQHARLRTDPETEWKQGELRTPMHHPLKIPTREGREGKRRDRKACLGMGRLHKLLLLANFDFSGSPKPE